MHLLSIWISVDQLNTSYSLRLDPARSKQLSTVAILGFQFGLYQVVAPLRLQYTFRGVSCTSDEARPV